MVVSPFVELMIGWTFSCIPSGYHDSFFPSPGSDIAPIPSKYFQICLLISPNISPGSDIAQLFSKVRLSISNQEVGQWLEASQSWHWKAFLDSQRMDWTAFESNGQVTIFIHLACFCSMVNLMKVNVELNALAEIKRLTGPQWSPMGTDSDQLMWASRHFCAVRSANNNQETC